MPDEVVLSSGGQHKCSESMTLFSLQVLCKCSFGEATVYEALSAHADGEKLLDM